MDKAAHKAKVLPKAHVPGSKKVLGWVFFFVFAVASTVALGIGTLSLSRSIDGSEAAPQGSNRPWKLNQQDLQEILYQAKYKYQYGKGRLIYVDADGDEHWETKLKLTGCSEPRLWKRRGNNWEFRCTIVPLGDSLQEVSAELDRRLSDVVAGLPSGWKIERHPQSGPYEPRVEVRDANGMFEFRSAIGAYEGGKFDAHLTLTAFGTRRGE